MSGRLPTGPEKTTEREASPKQTVQTLYSEQQLSPHFRSAHVHPAGPSLLPRLRSSLGGQKHALCSLASRFPFQLGK